MQRRLLLPLLAAMSFLYLGILVVTGAMPQQRQLARFEAKGLLQRPPESIQRIEILRGTERLVLHRKGEADWQMANGAGIGDAAARINTALKMLHNSGPVRNMAPAELAGIDRNAFGLDPPALGIRLRAADDAVVFAAQFGSRNPEDYLQYMQVDGDARLFLMSRFVGVEWDEAMTAALAH